MNTQYRKNLKAVLEASKSYCDESINNLKWELGTCDLSVDTNTDVAHIKTLPSGTIQTTVTKVEGVGYKVNQLVHFDTNSYTSGKNYRSDELGFTITADTTAINYALTRVNTITNHKYLIVPTITGTFTNPTLYVNSGYVNPYMLNNGIGIVTISNGATGVVFTYQGLANSSLILNVFDLTDMGIDSTSVDTAVAGLLARGINPYEPNPYDSGSIKNNAFTGVKVEGFNKWDEQQEVGNIDNSTGQPSYNTSSRRTKNYTSVLSNTNYYFYWKTFISNSALALYQYDSNNALIGEPTYFYSQTRSFTTAGNCKYIKFRIYNENWNENSNPTLDICINISGSANGTYVPYIQPTTISVDLTTIKDSNNVSLFPSGKPMGNSSVADFITPYNQESRWNEIDLSTIDDWEIRSGETNLFQSGAIAYLASKPADRDQVANALCDIYSIDTTNNVLGHTPNTIAIFPSGYIGIYDTSCSTIQELLTKLNGKKLQYERATYLTSTTNLTTLTKINAQSNGTITLNNTDNVDMPNTIKSLKEVAK